MPRSLLPLLRLPVLVAALATFGSVGCKGGSAPAKTESSAESPAKEGKADGATKKGFVAKGKTKDEGDLKPQYGQTENGALEAMMKEGKLLEDFCEHTNASLALPFDVPVVLEDCGEANAFYDPEKHQISMCYELVEVFAESFDKHADSEEMANAQIVGATVFTLYHELGHALVHIFELPITGKEEDAVDQLATLVLLSGGEEGRDQAIDGAEAFLPDEAESDLEELPFWGVHSLGEQRFYNTLCLVYGENPEDHQGMVEDEYLPRERAEQCPEEFDRVSKAWDTLLGPHFKG